MCRRGFYRTSDGRFGLLINCYCVDLRRKTRIYLKFRRTRQRLVVPPPAQIPSPVGNQGTKSDFVAAVLLCGDDRSGASAADDTAGIRRTIGVNRSKNSGKASVVALGKLYESQLVDGSPRQCVLSLARSLAFGLRWKGGIDGNRSFDVLYTARIGTMETFGCGMSCGNGSGRPELSR